MSPLEAPPTVYEAKRDLWLVIVVWVANLAMLAAAAEVWRSAGSLAFRLGFGVAMVAVTFFALWLIYGTRYVLTSEALVALCGPFKTVVPLAAIEEVRPSRSLLASPAPSLDRLEVRHSGGRKSLLISPADRDGFLSDLKLRCPQLVSRFDRLVSRAGGEAS